MTFEGVLIGMFLASTGIRAFKDAGAKRKIERQGYVVNPDRRSIFEKTSSFIKDYFYLIVPFYNIIKSIGIFLKQDSEYASNRFEILSDRERISTKQEETKKEVKKQTKKVVETPKNEETPVTKQERKLPEIKKEVVVNNNENVENNFTREELINYYYKKDAELRERHAKLISMNKVKEANELLKVIIDVDNRYYALVNETKVQSNSSATKLVRTK